MDPLSPLLGGEQPVPFAALLAGAEAFDAAAFGLSRAEAALMDPQQRLLLECVTDALAAVPGGLLPDPQPAPASSGDLRCESLNVSSDLMLAGAPHRCPSGRPLMHFHI